MRPVELAPSILSADLSRLAEEIGSVEPYAGRIHVDVMDGHFVPNLTMGPVVVASIRPVTSLPIEVHLMVEDPGLFVDPFAEAGADRLIFHIEVARDPAGLGRRIRQKGPAAGIALNPETPWRRVVGCLAEFDLVTVMTVNPGFGGQGFLEEVLPKVAEARETASERGLSVDIEVDGGIDSATAVRARKAGANVFVAGHAVFRSGDPALAARAIYEAIGAREG